MSAGRVLAAITASVAVGGCAVVVFNVGNANTEPRATPTSSSAAPTSRPAYLPVAGTSAAAGAVATARPARPAAPATTGTAAPSAAPVPATPGTVAAPVAAAASTPAATRGTAARPVVAAPRVVPRVAPRTTTRRVAPVARTAPRASGQRLPLRYSTGSATRVITVTAGSGGSTVATLQAWTKVSGGWRRYGSSATAHVGAQGIGRASESTSHTPAGSFTLTQAFGRRGDPGTALPYFRTTPSDYWISDSGRRYNTHQRCGSCGYNDGVNERLYYETPYYNYAVVIDYNTRNAPGGVHAGRGSAFFLHVTDGRPTAGCVAISQSRLVPLMRWLTPSAHPRILIGVT